MFQSIFPHRSLNVLLGPLGSKKTSLALDLAISVAAGSSWLGSSNPESPTLFVDKGLGDRELHRRVRYQLTARRAAASLPFYFYSNFKPLTNSQEVADLYRQAQVLNLGLVVIDSPLFLSLYLDRHKLHTFRTVLENLHSLVSAANLSILLIHDLSRHRTDLAQPLLDMGVDQVLWAQCPSNGSLVHLRTLASRDLPPISIAVQEAPHFGFAKATTKCSSDLGLVGLEVLAYMSAESVATTKMITSSIHATSIGRVINVIQELLRDGYLSRVNRGGRGSRALYSLTPAGRDLVT